MTSQILHGDCVAVIATMAAESLDACVTDPPYDLTSGKRGGTGEASLNLNSPAGRSRISTGGGFMGKEWDATGVAFDPQTWRVIYHVLKPGAHLLAFGGTRTYHRMVCAIEDAGFEIRDQLAWIFGQGFPKSLSLFRSIMSQLCPLHESAPHAVQVSQWHRLVSPVVKAPTAVALAEMLPEGRLVLLIRTGEEGDSSGVTGISLSVLMADTILSTEWSWQGYSAAHWQRMSTSIIAMAIEAITTHPILNYWNALTTPDGIIAVESRPVGCLCAVLPVVESLTGGSPKWSGILWPSAHAPVTAPVAPLIALGTGLKPSYEPIVLARKPLCGTVAANVLRHGTGALNIDGCRIEGVPDVTRFDPSKHSHAGWRMDATGEETAAAAAGSGRWPANICHDGSEEVLALFPETTSGTAVGGLHRRSPKTANCYGEWKGEHTEGDVCFGDSGSAARFFYCAKSSRAERDFGCEALPERTAGEATDREDDTAGLNSPRAGAGRTGGARNTHPTVKPLALMRWLVRLVTPPGGTVIDPFLGSGTTGMAAAYEGFNFIGIEREAEYLPLATARIAAAQADAVEIVRMSRAQPSLFDTDGHQQELFDEHQ